MAKYEINGKEVTKESFWNTINQNDTGAPTFIATINMSVDDEETRMNKLREGFEGYSTRHKAGSTLKSPEPLFCAEIKKMNSNVSNNEYFDKEIKHLNANCTQTRPNTTSSIGAFIKTVNPCTFTTSTTPLQEEKIIQDWEKKEDYTPKEIKWPSVDIQRCGLLNISKEEVWKTKDEFFKGKKESNGKLFYEFDWEFIEAAAKRMQANKGNKYEKFNWTKKIDVNELLQALNRHHIEVMKGNYDDGEEKLGHIVSYMCNAMMIWHQLKNHR